MPQPPTPLPALHLTISRTHAGPGSVELSDADGTLLERDYSLASFPEALLSALRSAGARVVEDSEYTCCSRGDRCGDFARAVGE